MSLPSRTSSQVPPFPRSLPRALCLTCAYRNLPHRLQQGSRPRRRQGERPRQWRPRQRSLDQARRQRRKVRPVLLNVPIPGLYPTNDPRAQTISKREKNEPGTLPHASPLMPFWVKSCDLFPTGVMEAQTTPLHIIALRSRDSDFILLVSSPCERLCSFSSFRAFLGCDLIPFLSC